MKPLSVEMACLLGIQKEIQAVCLRTYDTKNWMCPFKTNLNPFYKTYLDSLRLKNLNGPLWSPRSRLWSGCVSSDPRRELLEPKSSHIPLDEIQGFMYQTRLVLSSHIKFRLSKNSKKFDFNFHLN